MNLDFTSKKWKKNWAGGWSLLSCEYLGYQYTKQLEDILGISLQEALFIVHDGISSCYFIDEYKKAFGRKLADEAIKNPGLIDQWAKDLIAKTDAALSLIGILKTKEISKENFDSYIQAMWDYGVPHRIVKVAVDYLTPEVLKSHLSILEKARVHAEPVYEETENYMKYVAEKIGTKHGIRPELISAMTKAQFLTYLESENLPDEKKLEAQYEGGVLYISRGTSRAYFEKKDVEAVEKALIDKAAGNKLTGQVAYPGKTRGRVKIILDPLPEKPFDEGDILVTGMTRPDYIPYIKKSAGFITDAGGILSHAAITARELKKPCIIGTETGTKILKDGDMVEIDGENGIVTIIT